MDIKVIPICRIIQKRQEERYKDSFYSKKCKKDELNELWEKERLKKRQYQEKADDEYMESLRLKEIFQHKEDVAKLYEEKTVKK